MRNPKQKYEIPQSYAPFDVFSVAAIPAHKVKDMHAFQTLMTQKFQLMFEQAIISGVRVIIFPIPGSGIYAGGADYANALMASVQENVRKYHQHFDLIIFPDGVDVKSILTAP